MDITSNLSEFNILTPQKHYPSNATNCFAEGKSWEAVQMSTEASSKNRMWTQTLIIRYPVSQKKLHRQEFLFIEKKEDHNLPIDRVLL